MNSGSPSWARTNDPRINSPLLYRLSYRGMQKTNYTEEIRLRQIFLSKRNKKSPGDDAEASFREFWLPELGSNQRPTD